MTKHGLCKDTSGKKSRLYHIWEDMKSRCLNKNNKRFLRYGGRGISICDDWLEYMPFHNWATKNGYNSHLTIDRIKNDGDYEPSNCRWATSKQQANNRCDNVNIEFKGEIMTRQEWSEKLGFESHVLKNRLHRCWSIERALTTPKIKK